MSTQSEQTFSKLENSYVRRSQALEDTCVAWKEIVTLFPPEKLRAYTRRPSLELAMKVGDLGLALIWIVQAALVRPLLDAFLEFEQNTAAKKLIEKTIKEKGIGALAVSENQSRPVTIKAAQSNLILSGEKKYITGGHLSDFILLTGRYPEDQKLSSIFLLPLSHIAPSSFELLDLGCLNTACHSSLTLESYQPPVGSLLSAPPSAIRKLLRIRGIIERSLILESVAGLLIYIAKQISQHSGDTVLNISDTTSDLDWISRGIDQQIQAAEKGEFVQPIGPAPENLIAGIRQLKHFYGTGETTLPDSLHLRIKDLLFFTAAFKI